MKLKSKLDTWFSLIDRRRNDLSKSFQRRKRTYWINMNRRKYEIRVTKNFQILTLWATAGCSNIAQRVRVIWPAYSLFFTTCILANGLLAPWKWHSPVDVLGSARRYFIGKGFFVTHDSCAKEERNCLVVKYYIWWMHKRRLSCSAKTGIAKCQATANIQTHANRDPREHIPIHPYTSHLNFKLVLFAKICANTIM